MIARVFMVGMLFIGGMGALAWAMDRALTLSGF